MSDSSEKIITRTLITKVLVARNRRDDVNRAERELTSSRSEHKKAIKEAKRYHAALIALDASVEMNFDQYCRSVERANPS